MAAVSADFVVAASTAGLAAWDALVAQGIRILDSICSSSNSCTVCSKSIMPCSNIKWQQLNGGTNSLCNCTNRSWQTLTSYTN